MNSARRATVIAADGRGMRMTHLDRCEGRDASSIRPPRGPRIGRSPYIGAPGQPIFDTKLRRGAGPHGNSARLTSVVGRWMVAWPGVGRCVEGEDAVRQELVGGGGCGAGKWSGSNHGGRRASEPPGSGGRCRGPSAGGVAGPAGGGGGGGGGRRA